MYRYWIEHIDGKIGLILRTEHAANDGHETPTGIWYLSKDGWVWDYHFVSIWMNGELTDIVETTEDEIKKAATQLEFKAPL